MFVGL